ncbi:MAG: stage IV sporulation protein A [Oscillospiraceae bacterium]
MPSAGDLQLAEPEIVRKGGRYGVRLKASAKAIHMSPDQYRDRSLAGDRRRERLERDPRLPAAGL